MSAPLSLITAAEPARNQRILVIDDNTAIHEDIRKILGAPAKEDSALDADAAELFGLEVEELTAAEFVIDSAYQGCEGLEMVRRARDEGRPYAMAFVDVRMPPGWDGVETIRHLWDAYPELQVVICTAYSDYSWEETIRKVGKTDSLVILKKPFDNIEVLQLAHTLTQKWTLSHQLRSHLEGLDRAVAARTVELQSANVRLQSEITDREEAQLELSRSEERFEKAFQASPIPMAIHSLATERFLDVNDALLVLIGCRRLELIGRSPAELNLATDPAIFGALFAGLRRDRSLRNFEVPLETRVAGVRDCLISAEAFELGAEPVALVATQDVSEQRRLEKELRHAQKLEAVGQFAAGVAHDFNNMLTVIQGHASLQLAADHLNTDMAASMEQVSQAADRAAALTRQLLTFSRKQVVQSRQLDLNTVVRNLHGMLSRVIGAHIELRCEMAETLPAIFADQGNVEQVLMNLVVNSRDAMPEGGLLTIGTAVLEVGHCHQARNPQARVGPHLCLRVADTGSGMDPETLSHIFEPFFTTREIGKGTGLGLATAYGIVAQLDGWIEVESKPGQGTTFRIYLPASEEAASAEAVPSGSILRGGDETILVVEDEPAVREIMVHVLRQHGYSILEAGDGPEAIRIWAEHADSIDLLVTDIVMPNGIKGNILADRLQAERADLKIIFSSGYSAEFATGDTPLGDHFTFLQKPYKPEVLAKAVRDCLDGRKAQISSALIAA